MKKVLFICGVEKYKPIKLPRYAKLTTLNHFGKIKLFLELCLGFRGFVFRFWYFGFVLRVLRHPTFVLRRLGFYRHIGPKFRIVCIRLDALIN